MAAPQKHPADDIAASLARINGMLTMLSGVYDPHNGTFVTGIPFVHESVQAMEILVARATEALTVMYQTCDLTVVREIPPKKAAVAAKEAAKPVVTEPSKLDEAARAFQDAAQFAAEAKARASYEDEPHPYVQSQQASVSPASLQGVGERHDGMPARAAVTALALAAAKPESYMHAFGPDALPSRLTERVEKTLSANSVAAAPMPAPKPAAAQSVAMNTEKRAESYEELLRKITMVSSQAHAEGKAASVDGALLPLVETIRQDLAKMRSVA